MTIIVLCWDNILEFFVAFVFRRVGINTRTGAFFFLFHRVMDWKGLGVFIGHNHMSIVV